MLLTVHAQAQKKNDNPSILVKQADGSYAFEQVFEVPDITKDVLFERAKQWITSNIKSGDNNNIFDDKEFRISNTGVMNIDPKSAFLWTIPEGYFDFKLNLSFKDNKYKIRIDNIICSYIFILADGKRQSATQNYKDLKYVSYNKPVKVQIDTKLAALVTALDNAVRKKTDGNSDW